MGKVEVLALKEVDLEVQEGEFLAIVGPSGSGKTTLLNLIGCIDKPTSGRVYIEGEDIASLSFGKLAKIRQDKIGFIFQSFNLIDTLNCWENVELALLFLDKHFTKREIKTKVGDILEAVGLREYIKHRPNELSGGQKQRVGIARAIVKDPKIILADEPTANLDSQTAQEIINLMYDLNQKKNITFIFATHDILITQKANRIIKLKDGKITQA